MHDEEDNNERIKSRSAFSDPAVIESIIQTVDEIFIESIPVESVKILPRQYKYGWGLFILLTSVVLFFYFATISYYDGLNPFISIDANAGDCKEVTKPLTQVFWASDDGYWEGQVGFKYNRAMLKISFNSFTMTKSEFASVLLDKGISGLNQLNGQAENQNLAYNLVALTGGIFKLQTGSSLQLGYFSADPSNIFNRRMVATSLSHVGGKCNISSETLYDFPTATYTVVYSRADFRANCLHFISDMKLQSLGFSANSPSVRFHMDMRSTVTALAVNFGALALADLETVAPSAVIPRNRLSFEYQGKTYAIGQYFDIRYPGMTPIVCLFEASTEAFLFCLVQVSSVLMLPVLNHNGNNEFFPEYCNCSKPSIGRSKTCSQLSLLAGFLFNAEQITTQSNFHAEFFMFIDIYESFEASVAAAINVNPGVDSATSRYMLGVATLRAINDAAFVASFVSANSDSSIDLWSTIAGQFSFAFCGNRCSMLVVQAADAYNQGISQYYYELTNGSCAPLVDTSNWWRLVENPPTALTERYYSCTQDSYTNFLAAAGISYGNKDLVVLALALLLTPLACLTNAVRYKSGGPKKKRMHEFSEEEKNRALDILATKLLEVIETKHRGVTVTRLQSPAWECELQQLSEEIVTSSTLESKRSSRNGNGVSTDYDVLVSECHHEDHNDDSHDMFNSTF